MQEYTKLLEEVRRRKPDLDEKTLLQLVEEKKRKIGSGYLTEQGALFLVAAELGITFDRPPLSTMSLKDIYIGANEVTVVAKILSIGSSKTYSKKLGGEGNYRRVILVDRESTVQLTLWDDNVKLVEELGLEPGMAIRVVRGYVRVGLDGGPVMNLGTRGSLEILEDRELISNLPELDDLSKELSEVKEPVNHIIVRGIAASPSRLSEFVRKDGRPGRVVQFHLRDSKDPRSVRVAVWDPVGEEVFNISPGQVVTLVDVKSKVLSRGEVELHGGEFTTIRLRREEEQPVEKPLPKVLRLVSIGKAREGKLGTVINSLSVDREGKVSSLIFTGEALEQMSGLPPDSVAECSVVETSRGALICESLTKLAEDDGSLPSSSKFYRKASEVKGSPNPIFLEAIALSKSAMNNIITKEGSSVVKAELIVGDETGEVKLVAWRDLSKLLEGISPGQRLRFRAVEPKEAKDGTTFLQIKGYSSIESIQ